MMNQLIGETRIPKII